MKKIAHLGKLNQVGQRWQTDLRILDVLTVNLYILNKPI